MVRAVQAALRQARLQRVDDGARALALRYAAAIDGAAELAAELAELVPDNEDQARRLAVLARRVDAQVVLERIGPKLLACLEALGMSPRARAAVIGKGAGGDGVADSPAAAFRDRAKARRAWLHDAETVDAATS